MRDDPIHYQDLEISSVTLLILCLSLSTGE